MLLVCASMRDTSAASPQLHMIKHRVSDTSLTGREAEYLMDTLARNQLTMGYYVRQFEMAFESFVDATYALTCCNGTTALHLALLALNLQPGEEVLIPTLTYIATANAVRYCGGIPVPVDVTPDTWCIDPSACVQHITPRTRGIIAVHLYGHPCDMDRLCTIADGHDLWIVEDAAEAHGAIYRGRTVGTLGDISIFSFYGNKIITTGEGGMVVTNDEALAARVQMYRGQGQSFTQRYVHPVLGYNYRMTDMQAAIGVAQLERIETLLQQRREVAQWYRDGLPHVQLQDEHDDVEQAHWMVTMLAGEAHPPRDFVMVFLEDRGVETRPAFPCVHQQPIYLDVMRHARCPIAENISARGINLPTHPNLTEADVHEICSHVLEALQ